MFKNDRPIYIVGRDEVVRLDDVYKDVYTYRVSNERNNYSDQELINICTPIAETKNCYFIFTDNRLAFCMPQSVLKKTICLNSKDVITSLAHKLVFRNAFSDYVDMLPYKFVPYDMLRNKQAIDKLFGYENDDYVVQNFINNGGAGTFLLSNIINGTEKTKITTSMVATPFIKNALTVRVVAAIPKYGEYILFPGMLERHTDFGAFSVDYDEFNLLKESVRRDILILSDKIANRIRDIGYRGILDWEILLVEEKPYLQEINPRQSCILHVSQDLILRELGLPNYMSILIDRFYNGEGIQGIPMNAFDIIRPHNLVESVLRPELAKEFLESEFSPHPIIEGPDFHLFNVSINKCVDAWAKATNRQKMFNRDLE